MAPMLEHVVSPGMQPLVLLTKSHGDSLAAGGLLPSSTATVTPVAERSCSSVPTEVAVGGTSTTSLKIRTEKAKGQGNVVTCFVQARDQRVNGHDAPSRRPRDSDPHSGKFL